MKAEEEDITHSPEGCPRPIGSSVTLASPARGW